MVSKIIPNAFQSPNDYVDVAMELLTGEECKCLFFAARHILGWQDKINSREGVISLSMFERGYSDASGARYGGTGSSRAAVQNALDALVAYRLLVKLGEPTSDGQRWQLGDAPDWDGLAQRAAAWADERRLRTEKATAVRQANRAAGTSDVPVRGTNHPQYVGRTDASTSDVLNQNQSKPIQSQSDPEPPRANIFTLYEEVFGIIPPTIVDALKDAVQEFPADWITDAFKLTRDRRGRSWKYTRAILDNWSKFGRDDQKPASPPPPSKSTPPKPDPLKERIETILTTLPLDPPADYLPGDPQRAFAWKTTGRRAVARQLAEKESHDV